jgi:hypothetical protein
LTLPTVSLGIGGVVFGKSVAEFPGRGVSGGGCP